MLFAYVDDNRWGTQIFTIKKWLINNNANIMMSTINTKYDYWKFLRGPVNDEKSNYAKLKWMPKLKLKRISESSAI